MGEGISRRTAGFRLFATAALSLFVELALIRWMGANVIYLGYFSNFVLLACFLGLGIGFLLVDSKRDLFEWSPVVLALMMGVTLASRIELSLPGYSEVVYFSANPMNETSMMLIPVVMTGIFVGTVTIFAGFGQAIGRLFAPFEPIPAYTIDIVGSLAGIVLFTAMSFASLPAYVWFGLAGVAFIAMQARNSGRPLRIAVVGAIGITALAWASHRDTRAVDARWSPYQFLKVYDGAEGTFSISANRVPHQFMVPVELDMQMYRTPFEIAEEHGEIPEKLMVIGAGSGTDVAHALAAGVEHVHAVEIDPVIAEIGEDFNPESPYSDERVELTIDDGRHVLQHGEGTYDMIIFALPDSLALLSSQSSVRLESFLFTRESFEQARSRLEPGGILLLYNFYRSPYVVERIARTLEDIYGHRPEIVNEKDSGITIIAISDTLSSDAGPVVDDIGPIPTDDWPFLYLRDRSLPSIYIWLVLGIWLLTLIAVFTTSPRESWRKSRWPFFFMGAAFLLLETKSIVQFSILFGATWLVNSLVFAGVLLAVLAANAIVYYLNPKTLWPWYVALAVALAIGWFVPIGELAALESDVARYGAAVALLFSPIFFANMIFSQTFAHTEQAAHSFGWNILGMMIGGTIEYSSMLLGYQNLAIVVAVFYALAFVTTWRGLPEAGKHIGGDG